MENQTTVKKKIPVLVLAFNRADHVTEAMKPIREYQPDRLYLACDGPRINIKGEQEAVENTQKTMLNAVDWSCDIQTLFRKNNLGCAQAVYDAITWFFEHEEYGIIVEDDIVISQDFFKLCEILLPYYAQKDNVMHINSQYYGENSITTNTYTFGKAMYCWGWASWARAWKRMDMGLTGWPSYNKWQMIKYYGFFKSLVQYFYWSKDYKKIKEKRNSSWATIWNFSVLLYNGLCINPKVNLSLNIGLNSGTHYNDNDTNPYEDLKIGALSFPLIHPQRIEIDSNQLKVENRDFFRIRMIGLRKKIKNFYYEI